MAKRWCKGFLVTQAFSLRPGTDTGRMPVKTDQAESLSYRGAGDVQSSREKR